MKTLLIKNLTKFYKNRCIVDNVSLQINSKEIIGLLGPNGAGKTTLFYMVLGMIPIDSGHVFIGEQDISLFPLHIRSHYGIGYLPQESSIFRGLSVFNNLMAILQIRKDLNKKQRYYYINNLMSIFNISNIKNNFGKSLSGGERRRVEIARAIAANPKFILLDEPFAGVDPISIIDLKNIIKKITNNGIGVLITDHNVRETLDVCNRAYIVNQGKLIAHGTPSEILHDDKVKKFYLGDKFRL